MNGLLWTLKTSGAHFILSITVWILQNHQKPIYMFREVPMLIASLIKHPDRILELESMEKDRNRIMFETENWVETFPRVGQLGTREGLSVCSAL